MLHKNKEEFLSILERTSAQTDFSLALLEKDYYITIVLSQINDKLSNDLILKGGTCLNKIYYSYYRLSEDIDFTLKLPTDKPTRTTRSNTIKPIKNNIKPFLKELGLSIDDEEIQKAGRNESKQYIFYIKYDSVLLKEEQSIKIEIGLRFNPILSVEKHKINHKYLHPFTREPLLDAGNIICLSLKELVAEKLRAAATREIAAPRDFYDLGYLINTGVNFRDKELLTLFKDKLKEDNFSIELKKYRHNLGRPDKEIKDMKSRIKEELYEVLIEKERKGYDIQNTLDTINNVFKDIDILE